jgi:hypothetical protein
LQVERGVEGVSELHEIGHVGRFDTRIGGVEERFAGGAVVAFEVVAVRRR